MTDILRDVRETVAKYRDPQIVESARAHYEKVKKPDSTIEDDLIATLMYCAGRADAMAAAMAMLEKAAVTAIRQPGEPS